MTGEPSITRKTSSTPLKGVVIGAGHFGRFHAQKLAEHPAVDFRAVIDLDAERGQAVASDAGVPWHPDLESLGEDLDLVTVATPAKTHARIAISCLKQGLHVFVEKPIATTVEDAEAMVAAAASANRILQIDHQERYFLEEIGLFENPASTVRSLQVRRLGPPPPRPSDCSAVMDLTIHDLDWIHAWLGTPAQLQEAQGSRVDSAFIETMMARFSFPGERHVEIETSRVHPDRCRDAIIETESGSIHVDFVGRTSSQGLPNSAEKGKELYGLHPFAESDYVGKSIAHFIHCIHQGHTPKVDGNAGLMALKTTLHLDDYLEKHV